MVLFPSTHSSISRSVFRTTSLIPLKPHIENLEKESDSKEINILPQKMSTFVNCIKLMSFYLSPLIKTETQSKILEPRMFTFNADVYFLLFLNLYYLIQC